MLPTLIGVVFTFYSICAALAHYLSMKPISCGFRKSTTIARHLLFNLRIFKPINIGTTDAISLLHTQIFPRLYLDDFSCF